MVVVMVMMVMVTEELRKLNARIGLGARRVVLDQGGNRVGHRLEQVAICCHCRAIQWLGWRSLAAAAGRDRKGGSRPE
jgi:hypothetical protein